MEGGRRSVPGRRSTLIVAATVLALTAAPAMPVPRAFCAVPAQRRQPVRSQAEVLRGVVLGAFAGVVFFLGLVCVVWSALAEAGQQRAEIPAELVAPRTHFHRTYRRCDHE
jgi:hypothetical protein